MIPIRSFIASILAAGLCGSALHAQATARPDLSLVSTRSFNLDTDEGTWISLDVSTDGRSIVFDLLGDLYTLPIAGGTATQLTKGMMYDAQPRFSPDGKSVVFTSDRDGGDNVWTINMATGRATQVTKGKSNRYRSPEWTPDGQYIVVSRAPQPIGPSKPWMFHKDGGNGIQLVRDPAPLPNGAFPLSLVGAAFGSDDRYIWFAQRTGAWEYNAGFPQYQLVTVDRQTGRRDTRANLLGGAIRPALSPDGRYLAYGSRYEAQTGLRLRDFESGDERWLAYPIQRDEQESVASLDALPGFSFTPDSKAVILSYGGKIWRVPVDGAAPTAIPFRVQSQVEMGPKLAFNYRVSDSAEFIVRQIRDAVPSPDGKRLAFVAMDKLYLMDYPAGTPRRVTDTDGTEAQPAWSPDGQSIAWVSWTKSGGQVHRATAAGGRAVQLTQSRAMYSQPVWSPDASRIVVTRSPAQPALEEGGFSGAAELVWVPANGGRATLIAPTGGRGGVHFARDTARIYMYSGGSGLVSMRWDGTDERTHLRVTGARGPEATAASSAATARLSPDGANVLVQVANDLFVLPLIESGEAPTISLGTPDNAELPVRRLTEIGGQFPAWSSDGRRVHWSIGNSHFVYDLDRARQIDDSIAAAAPATPATPAAPAAGAAPAAQPPRYQPVETKIILRGQRDIPQATAVFRGARIITMKGDEVIARGDIVVRNNRIVAVGASGSVTVPAGARVIDVSGKTILPGFVDTHAHLGLRSGIHQQPWSYIVNLAYGVTTTRDPQTSTPDVFAYADMVDSGMMPGPRVYATGPGVFAGSGIDSREAAFRFIKRYKEAYKTNTLKQYVAGDRIVRQWIIEACKEYGITATIEGSLDLKLNLTQMADGYSGQEHSLPIAPLYKDVTTFVAKTKTFYTPTILVAYGAPWSENFWFETESPANDAKLKKWVPWELLDGMVRRRPQWFLPEEYGHQLIAKGVADVVHAGGRAGLGSHGQMQGLGAHWETWNLASGGLTPHETLQVVTLFSAEAIGLQQDLGSLEAGKLADLLVLDRNPLDNIKNTNSIRYVMKNGELYEADTLNMVWPQSKPLPKQFWWDTEPSSKQ